jgi:transcriptional regulator with XRE-family HTH domain
MSPVRERDTAALSLFADEMKAAREQRGWSQADLADQIPYSLSTISMVEALHRVPTRDLAGHLDKAFGTPGTFTRLEGRLRDLPFPASFRPFALIAGFTSAVGKTRSMCRASASQAPPRLRQHMLTKRPPVSIC